MKVSNKITNYETVHVIIVTACADCENKQYNVERYILTDFKCQLASKFKYKLTTSTAWYHSLIAVQWGITVAYPGFEEGGC